MTVQPIALTEQEARRLTERIRAARDRVSSAWSDLAERVAEAYERRADLALGYGHASPSGDVVGEARRALVERRPGTTDGRHQLRPDAAAALGIEAR